MDSANFIPPWDEILEFGRDMRDEGSFHPAEYNQLQILSDKADQPGNPILTADLNVWKNSEGESNWSIRVYEQSGINNDGSRDYVMGFDSDLPEQYGIEDVVERMGEYTV